MNKLALVMAVGLLVVLLGQASVCFAQYRWNAVGTRTDIRPIWNAYFQQQNRGMNFPQNWMGPMRQFPTYIPQPPQYRIPQGQQDFLRWYGEIHN